MGTKGHRVWATRIDKGDAIWVSHEKQPFPWTHGGAFLWETPGNGFQLQAPDLAAEIGDRCVELRLITVEELERLRDRIDDFEETIALGASKAFHSAIAPDLALTKQLADAHADEIAARGNSDKLEANQP